MSDPKKPEGQPLGDPHLRSAAEEQLARSPGPPPEMQARTPEEIIHELQVHQIELEMQNEELKRAHLALEESRDRYQNLYDFSPVGYFSFTHVGRIVEVNLTGAALLGVPRPKLINRGFGSFVAPEDLDRWERHLVSVLRSGVSVTGDYEKQVCELPLRRADGSTFHARLESVRLDPPASGLPDEQKPPAGGGTPVIRIAMSDITEHKQADELFQARAQELEQFFGVTADLLCIADTGGFFHRLNAAWERTLGYTPDELMATRFLDFIHPEDVDSTQEAIAVLASQREVTNFVNRYRGKDGSYRWFEWRAVPAGTLIYAAARDITERKQIEDAQLFLAQCGYTGSGEYFLESLARYLAENLRMDYVCIDRLQGDRLAAQTVAVYSDGHFEDNVAYTLKDTPCGDVVEKTICCFPRDVRRLFPRDAVLQEMMAESYVGTILWDSRGQAIGLIAVIGRRPLTDSRTAERMLRLVALRAAHELERTQAEEALRQAGAELARSNKDLEQFASVASHDLQEPLRQVVGFLQLLRGRYQGKLDEKADEFIRYAVDGGMRMSKLIGDLLAYARVGTRGEQPSVMSCQEALDNALANLRATISENSVRVTHDSLPTLVADGSQIAQLFQNLIGNALKFRREGVPPEIHVGARQEGDEWVLWVKDNGIGIPSEQFDRVFVIFQRLHGVDEYPGTGMGLAICKKIVERHRGRIWVESKVGEGTTLYFSLPA